MRQQETIELVVDSSSGGPRVRVACPPHLHRVIEIASDYVFLGLRLTVLKDATTDVEQLKLCLHRLEVALGEKQDLLFCVAQGPEHQTKTIRIERGG